MGRVVSTLGIPSHNVLPVNIFRFKTFALLDTGAFCSIVPEKIFKKLSMPMQLLAENDIHTVHVADGKPIQVLGTAEISLKINGLIVP